MQPMPYFYSCIHFNAPVFNDLSPLQYLINRIASMPISFDAALFVFDKVSFFILKCIEIRLACQINSVTARFSSLRPIFLNYTVILGFLGYRIRDESDQVLITGERVTVFEGTILI